MMDAQPCMGCKSLWPRISIGHSCCYIHKAKTSFDKILPGGQAGIEAHIAPLVVEVEFRKVNRLLYPARLQAEREIMILSLIKNKMISP